MITLAEAAENVGRGVVYQSHAHGRREDGVITGVSESYVFVRYANQRPDADGKATACGNLTWLHEGAE